MPEGEKVAYNRYLKEARETLGEERFVAAWAEGREMTLEEAADYAIEH